MLVGDFMVSVYKYKWVMENTVKCLPFFFFGGGGTGVLNSVP
jgi:hypothetical protein